MTTQADALNRIAKAMEERNKKEQGTLTFAEFETTIGNLNERFDGFESKITELQLEITDLKQQIQTRPPQVKRTETRRHPIQTIGWTQGVGTRGPYESQLITEDNLQLAGEIESTKGRFNKGGYNYWLGNRDPPRIFRRKQR